MLVVEINDIDTEPAKAGLACLPDVVGRAADAEEAPVARAPDERFVCANTVNVGGIEEVDAEFQRAMNDADRRGVLGGAVEIGHAHAAEANRGDALAGSPKQAL